MTLLLAVAAMGTRFEWVLVGDEPVRLRSAGETVIKEIEELHRLLSRFRPDSDISRINKARAGEKVRVDGRTFAVVEESVHLSERTKGAFDITVGPLLRCWGIGSHRSSFPTEKELQRAISVVGFWRLNLNPKELTVEKAEDGVELDLGGIGKGWALDRAREILKEEGIESFFIHAGTSSAIGCGQDEDGRPWRVALDDPEGSSLPVPYVALNGAALSVSGPFGRPSCLSESARDQGEAGPIGHIVDPQTGLPLSGPDRVAVFSPSATVAEAVSTGWIASSAGGVSDWLTAFPQESVLIRLQGKWSFVKEGKGEGRGLWKILEVSLSVRA